MQKIRAAGFPAGVPTFSTGSDFDEFVTADVFTTVASDAGGVTNNDERGGTVLVSPSDGTVADNDETYLKGTKETLLFAADKPIVCEARVKWTEANTDDANIIVGFMNAVAANALVDDGGGPPSNYYGCNFHKVDGGTKWLVETSMGTTQVTNTTSTTAGGSSYQNLRIEVTEEGSAIYVTFFINGVQCVDNTTGALISHRVAISSATEMQLVVGAKNGSANHEQLYVDYLFADQAR